MRTEFVVVKLKSFKVLRSDLASMKWFFLGVFWALTPPNMVQYSEILTRGSTLASKNIV